MPSGVYERTPKICKAISDGRKGKKFGPPSEQTKEKISIANTGKKRSEEWCINLSNSRKGKKLSKEEKEQRKLSRIENYNSKVLPGTKFGKLTVVGDSPSFRGSDNQLRRMIEVSCECGSPSFSTRKDSLITGNTESCGCLTKENTLKALWKEDREGIGFRSLLSGYKNRAKRRGLCWELTDEEFKKLTKSNCWYTGREPNLIAYRKHCRGSEYIYNGVDRLDNSIGYTPENCVPCCCEVNLAKRELGLSDFFDLVKEIYSYKKLGETVGDS